LFNHNNIYSNYQKQFHPLIEFLLKYHKITKQSIKECQKCQGDDGDMFKDDKMAIETMGMKKMMRAKIHTKTTTTKYKILRS
jgi:hypothetical protein